MGQAASFADTRASFLAVFPGVMFAMVLASIDQTILAAALPAIRASLGGSSDLSWVMIAYLIAATATAPLYGHLGDRFGRRRVLLTALAVFTGASALCAAAPTLPALIAARAVQGLGAGGLMTLAQALIGEHVPPRERGRFQGYFASVFAVSSSVGPVLGGYLTEHFSWHSVFLINLPLGALAAYLALRIPAPASARAGRFQPDVLGTLLFALATSALLLALTHGAELALLGVAAAGVVAFFWWERRAADPVMPLHLLEAPAISLSIAMVFCFAAALFAAVIYLPLYLQEVRGLRIGESGLLLLPITLGVAAASTTTGKLISLTQRLTIFPAAGLALSSAAFASLAVAVSAAPTAAVLALAVVAAMGLGTVMPVCQIIVQDTAGKDTLGSATALLSVSRSVGGAFGVALAGALLFGLASHTLEVRFTVVFGALAAVTALGCALALAIPRKRL